MNNENKKYEKDFNEYKKEVVLLNNKKIKYNQMQKDLRKYYNQKFIKKIKLKSSLKYLNKKNIQSLTEMQHEINEEIEMIQVILDDILEKENKLDNKIDKINNEMDKLYFKYYEQNLDKLKYDKLNFRSYDNFNNNYQNKFKEYYKNIKSILKVKKELKEKITKLKINLQTDKQRDELDDLYLQFAHQHDLDKKINNNLYIYLSNFVKVDQILKDINHQNNPKSETNLESEESEKEKKDFITELISNELITFDIFILFIGLIEQNSDTKSILEHIFLIDNMGISHGCMICNRYITKDNQIRSFYKSNNLKYGLCLRDALIRKVFNYGRFDSGCFHSYECSCKKCRYI